MLYCYCIYTNITIRIQLIGRHNIKGFHSANRLSDLVVWKFDYCQIIHWKKSVLNGSKNQKIMTKLLGPRQKLTGANYVEAENQWKSGWNHWWWYSPIGIKKLCRSVMASNSQLILKRGTISKLHSFISNLGWEKRQQLRISDCCFFWGSDRWVWHSGSKQFITSWWDQDWW